MSTSTRGDHRRCGSKTACHARLPGTSNVPLATSATNSPLPILLSSSSSFAFAEVSPRDPDVASHLGVEIFERVGELDGVWLIRAPQALLWRHGEMQEELGLVERGFKGEEDEDLAMRAYEEYEEELLKRGEADDRVLQSYASLKSLKRSLRRRVSGSSILGGGKGDSRTVQGRSDLQELERLASSITHLSKQHLRQLPERAPPPIRPEIMDKYDIMDSFFPMQHPEHTMNATPVWDMGYTGKGVITALIDDKLDSKSDDLKPNFDAENSYDFNSHVKSPVPKSGHDHHGTRCAGQIGAAKNGACGVGITHEGKVAGLRILGGRITLADEAIALNYGYQTTSIYSCSWGPRDDGTKMQAPPYVVRKVVLNGINQGRGGDVTVGIVDWQGEHSRYSKMCAANMVVAYSSGGGGGGEHIVTKDVSKNEYAINHRGTSAAAPNVAGVIALTLEARPELTWRDVQHLAVYTARRINEDDRDWQHNTNSGRWYSYKYGFGAMDASRYVAKAKEWTLVGPQAWYETETIQLDKGEMDEEEEFSGGTYIDPDGVTSKITVTQAQVTNANLDVTRGEEGKGLEHVTVKVWIAHTRRGDVRVELVSPNGVKSVLAAPRERDDAVTGFPGWTFMSVKHWGENPVGTWTIKVSDQQSETETGAFLGWNMIFWGSARDPSKATEKWHMDMNDEDGDFENVLPPDRKPGKITPARPEAPGHSETEIKTKTTMKPSGALNSVEKKPMDLSHDPSKEGEGLDPSHPGTFPGIKDEVSKRSWLAGVISILILVNIVAASYFCCWKPRSTSNLDGGDYGPLACSEPIGMSSLRRGAGGYRDREGDDQGNNADERTRLAARDGARSTAGLGFHSGFLDDDDPMTAASARSDMVTPRNDTAAFGT
ncbi:kex protein [Coprinopsis sp. MPI-PUGE-AT-0042]|nr:kex protein [Coprinopsis sp. MPI-PUGE-AT-0042]